MRLLHEANRRWRAWQQVRGYGRLIPKDLPTGPDADADRVVLAGTLGNGLRVVIRPLLPGDRERVAAGFRMLSEHSRYLRFMSGKGNLSAATLDRLVDDVDQHTHVALAMMWPRHGKEDVLVGVGRFIRLQDDPATADVAVTIADELHGQGAGRLLLQALVIRAVEEGVRRFTATMVSTNHASHRMMQGAGTVVRDEREVGVRTMDIELPGPPGASPVR